MLILGLGKKEKPIKEKEDFCSHCQRKTLHKEYESQEYLSIFFIPFTYESEKISKCLVCGKERKISPLKEG
jgi:predicted nucleic acid-binding Zn ribbon protein